MIPNVHNHLRDSVTQNYLQPNIVRVVKSRRMRWAGHVARMGEDRGVHRVLVGRHEVNRPLGRPRRRGKDNIKMDLQEVGGGRRDRMELAQDRDRWRTLVGTVRNFSSSINAGNFLTSCKVYWLASQEGLCSME
jgi:hypothetical protein